ncbi:MFS transporter [Rhodococcus jostii]|uniref:MFS transporter n=1 Tax=Rhodococcus jostii TaxID=132919 RepID=UPI003653E1AF
MATVRSTHPSPAHLGHPSAVTAPSPRYVVPAMVVGAFGVYFGSLTPTIITLSIRIFGVDAEGKTLGLSTVMVIGALVALASIPLFGSLSDRTTSRLGRRTPWLIGGALVALAGLTVIALATNVAAIAAGWALAQLGYSAALAGFVALIPDFVPDHLRARLSGMIGFVTAFAVLAGVTLGSRLADHPVPMMIIPGIAAVVCLAVVAVVIRGADSGVDPATLQPYSFREFASSYWINPIRHADFALNWISRFLFGLAMVGLTTYATYFLVDAAGLSITDAAAEYAHATAVTTPISIVSFLLAGFLSDKLGRRKAFVAVASFLTGGALVYLAVNPHVSGFLLAFVAFTIGQACYLTVDIAIAAAVVPDVRQTAKAMSVYQVAATLPYAIVPLIGAVLLPLTGNNYALLFCILAACAAVAGAAVLFVRSIR